MPFENTPLQTLLETLIAALAHGQKGIVIEHANATKDNMFQDGAGAGWKSVELDCKETIDVKFERSIVVQVDLKHGVLTLDDNYGLDWNCNPVKLVC